MRNPDLGTSQSGAFPRKRRDQWPPATRTVRFPVTSTRVTTRRDIPRRGVR
ncbi:hypothetical protein [Kribbella sp. CA-294648]|uniref:hypothetical protein n=1 Tax=Kribbella sp. CA-294648 TaxID=3239948 RepID=UPI003D92FA18